MVSVIVKGRIVQKPAKHVAFLVEIEYELHHLKAQFSH